MSKYNDPVIGVIAGTTASQYVKLGFKPKYVRLENIGAALGSMEWMQGMSETAGVSIQRVVGGTKSMLTTTGIKIDDYGFTIPSADAVTVVNGQNIAYRAE